MVGFIFRVVWDGGWSGFEAVELQGSKSNLIRKYLVLRGGEGARLYHV
jgi:hypothetical protein